MRRKHRGEENVQLKKGRTRGCSGVDLRLFDNSCGGSKLIDDAKGEVAVDDRGLASEVAVWSADFEVFL